MRKEDRDVRAAHGLAAMGAGPAHQGRASFRIGSIGGPDATVSQRDRLRDSPRPNWTAAVARTPPGRAGGERVVPAGPCAPADRRGHSMSPTSKQLAEQYAQRTQEPMRTAATLSKRQWQAPCVDKGWTVGVTAHHLAATVPLILDSARSI